MFSLVNPVYLEKERKYDSPAMSVSTLYPHRWLNKNKCRIIRKAIIPKNKLRDAMSIDLQKTGKIMHELISDHCLLKTCMCWMCVSP